MQSFARRTVCPIVVVAFLVGCAPSIRSDPTNLGDYAQPGNASGRTDTIFYQEAGMPGNPLVVFVHGTPGSWHAFESYLKHPRLRDTTHMIAVDRLGFGASQDSGVQTSFEVQSDAISQVFEANESSRKIVILGHSLGGSIGLRVALDYPEQVGGLVIVSSAISPGLGRRRWYNRFAALPLIKHIIPNDLKLANAEVLALRGELLAIEPTLAGLAIPVTVVQGQKDKLVAAANADFAEQMLVKADLKVKRFPDDGHFILWERPDMIVDEILDLVGRMEPNTASQVLIPQ
jgi:pimeloyl-ACP methyl ester carboxylesterase